MTTTIRTTGQRAIVRNSIIAGQPPAVFEVDVVTIDGDRLTYTTDGIWMSVAGMSPYSTWELIDPQAEFEAPEADPAEADPAEAEPAVETRFFDIEHINREGFTYRNRTRPDANTGREVAIYTDRNGCAIVVLYVDGFYVNQAEYSAAELALIGDYA